MDWIKRKIASHHTRKFCQLQTHDTIGNSYNMDMGSGLFTVNKQPPPLHPHTLTVHTTVLSDIECKVHPRDVHGGVTEETKHSMRVF